MNGILDENYHSRTRAPLVDLAFLFAMCWSILTSCIILFMGLFSLARAIVLPNGLKDFHTSVGGREPQM
jgi:hypothetical protein